MLKKLTAALANPRLILAALILLSFGLHAINIGYNSPSNDEAVYIKIGTNAIFKGKWGLYDTASWVGGHPYFYPTLSAIAYSINGVNGSRILSVIFSVICLYFVAKIALAISRQLTGDRRKAVIAAIISTILIGFSATTAYISRLATYDMPSFTFMVMSIYYLIRAGFEFKKEDSASYFLISAILLATSFAFKYIAILYLPIIIGASFVYVNGMARKPLNKTWKIYFLMPLLVLLMATTLTQSQYLLSNVRSQLSRETVNTGLILWTFVRNSFSIIPFWIIGSIALISKKQWRIVVISLLMALSILVFHILTLRIAAWDKHIFLLVLPFGITAGVGTSMLTNNKIVKGTLAGLLAIYVIFNVYDSAKYNSLWKDYRQASNFLSQNLKGSDNLLAEEVSSLLVPANVTTFDWFSYKGQQGSSAYKKAINDGYFNYIEISNEYSDTPLEYQNLQKDLIESIKISYLPIYNDKYFSIYKRGF